MGVPNDATNACVFLALQICDAILDASSNKNSLATCLDDIPQIATQMITSYPLELNKIRELSSLYTVLDANKLMRDHNHLKNEFEFTEELPYADGDFAEVSRDRLQQKVQELANDQTFLSIYTCEPFSFLLGSLSRQLFRSDDSPIVTWLNINSTNSDTCIPKGLEAKRSTTKLKKNFEILNCFKRTCTALSR